MKKIWKYLLHHIREDFKTLHYIFVIFFVAVVLFINYRFHFDDLVLKRQVGFTKFFYYFLFYASAYYVTLASAAYATKLNFFKSKLFWIKSLVALTVLSLDSSVPFLSNWIAILAEPDLQFWMYKVVINLIGVFTILVPLMLTYFRFDRKEKHFYGLYPKRFDTSPYFWMLALMLPIMIGASFLPSFLKQYPMYKASNAHFVLEVPEWVTVLIYEFAYGFDFITVEFLFRGFMVIGMIHILGRNSVLAMAITYCFLHTGKPLGEAISSVFGGYLLGVIAYETKSIWGGIIVHVGIAWMMEVISFSRNYF